MNEKIINLAIKSGLLNYVDNETPRRYFLDGYADLEEVEKFAELIVNQCTDLVRDYDSSYVHGPSKIIKAHFGVE